VAADNFRRAAGKDPKDFRQSISMLNTGSCWGPTRSRASKGDHLLTRKGNCAESSGCRIPLALGQTYQAATSSIVPRTNCKRRWSSNPPIPRLSTSSARSIAVRERQKRHRTAPQVRGDQGKGRSGGGTGTKTLVQIMKTVSQKPWSNQSTSFAAQRFDYVLLFLSGAVRLQLLEKFELLLRLPFIPRR